MAYGGGQPIWRVATREEAAVLIDHLRRAGVGATVMAGRRDGSGPFDITVRADDVDYACNVLGIGVVEPSGLLAGRPVWVRLAGLFLLVAVVVVAVALVLAVALNTST
ncbi:MAG: hypothetical protein RIE08_17145 [Acidimicrobiales bacterium]